MEENLRDMMTSYTETISILRNLCKRNPPVISAFRSQRAQKMQKFDIFYGFSLKKLLTNMRNDDLRLHDAHVTSLRGIHFFTNIEAP